MKDIILQDVLDYILKCKDNNKLVEINEVIKDRFKTTSSYLKYNLKIGDKVRITGSGRITKGVIHKVNRTRAVVISYWNDKKTKFNVPFTMLTKEVSNGS